MKDKEILIVYKGHHCKLKGHIVDLPDQAVIYADENEVAPWLVPELNRTMPCVLCDGGTARLTFEPITVNSKGKNHQVDQWFYRCEKCKQEFETEDCMKESLNQVQ